MATTTVTDNPARERYEIRLDGAVAGFASYRIRDGVAAVDHTEVSPDLQGRGLASALVAGVLDDLRRRGLRVRPFCPFVASYIGRRPEYRDLVPDGEAQRFGLS